jgi:hypothetical protein
VVVFSSGGAGVTGFANVSGNVTGGNIITAGVVNATGNISGGNLSVSTGEVTLGSIVNANANGVGNIGSASLYFNTIFATATSAQYADLAEMYETDRLYEAGTVVSFGGEHDITQSVIDCDRRVAGVISTNPAYIMNSALSADSALPVALMGKVPTKVTGPVSKGDLMVSAGDGTARSHDNPPLGSVLGKSLENFTGVHGVINIVVGRL